MPNDARECIAAARACLARAADNRRSGYPDLAAIELDSAARFRRIAVSYRRYGVSCGGF